VDPACVARSAQMTAKWSSPSFAIRICKHFRGKGANQFHEFPPLHPHGGARVSFSNEGDKKMLASEALPC